MVECVLVALCRRIETSGLTKAVSDVSKEKVWLAHHDGTHHLLAALQSLIFVVFRGQEDQEVYKASGFQAHANSWVVCTGNI